MFQEWSMMSNIILNLLSILILLIFIGVIYAIVYAIFMFIFSWGSDEKIKKAWNSIRYSILGFIISLIILIAIPWFLRAIKVPWYSQYTSSNIFKTSKFWVDKIIKIFNNTSSSIDFDEKNDYQL